MNGRGLRSGALRLIATAAVALGIALFAGASTAHVVIALSGDSSQPVVVVSGGSAATSDATPSNQAVPLESTWN